MKRALIVEDDHVYGQYFKVLLGRENIKTVLARNGEIAMEMAMIYKFDILFVDIALGFGIDGIALCKLLKKKKQLSKVPFISVSATALSQSDELIEAGFNEYFQKPFKPSQLLPLLKKYLTD